MSEAVAAAGVAEALPAALESIFEAKPELLRAHRIAGGASKEAWAVDISLGGAEKELLVRRDMGGSIYSDALSLQQEALVLQSAYRNGVTVPKVYGYIADLAGRPAFAMARLPGEGIGRRIVKDERLAAARASLPEQMASELATIHALSNEGLEFLPGADAAPAARHVVERLYHELDATQEPHPAIEYTLYWLKQNLPPSAELCVLHGDFRLGNLLVSEQGLSGVLDWEFAHIGDPAEDLAWPLVRAWRFGRGERRLGGIGEVEPYLAHYNRLTGREISPEALFYWEVMGNVKWAIGASTQARRHLNGEERSVELAVLGRLAAEMEHEMLRLLERG